MIKSALSLQNKIDQKYRTKVDSFNNDFAVESLANAGQRLGMKGDSVKYSSFTLRDLLTYIGKDMLASKDCNCVVKYEQTESSNQATATMCVIGAGEKYNGTNSLGFLLDVNENETINLFDEHYLAQEFQLDKPVNNIEYFVENSFLTVNENIFKTFLFGKKLGYRDSDDFNIEVMYNEFDLSENMLERAVRMYHLFSMSNSNYYATIDIQRNHARVSEADGKDFIMKIFIMNDKMINVAEDNINASDLKKSFCLKYLRSEIEEAKKLDTPDGFKRLYNKFINVDSNESNYFNYINEDSSLYKIISDYNVLNTNYQNPQYISDMLNYDVISHAILKQTNVLDKSIIGDNLNELSNKIAMYLAKNGVEQDITDTVNEIYRDTSYYAAIIKNNQASDLTTNLTYNSSKNVITATTYNYIKDEIKNLLDSDYIGIDKRIEYINNDIVYLFPKLLEKYNNEIFGTKAKVIKNIILRLYERIFNNSETAGEDKFGTLYIPLNYSFNYVANSSNPLEIFYSSDIYVNLTNLDDLTATERHNALTNSSSLLYDYLGESKSKIFKFEIEYNALYDNIINNVYVTYVHTLPFINGKNTWTINDNDTNIPAIASIVNKFGMMMLFNSYDASKNEFSTKFLNIDESTVMTIHEWEKSSVEYNSSLILTYVVPKIDMSNIDQFLSSTIMLVCDSTCVTSSNDVGVDDSIVYTLFLSLKYNNNSDTYNFLPVYVGDSLFNMTNVINRNELISTISKTLQYSSRQFDSIVINNRANRRNQEHVKPNNMLMIAINTPEEMIGNVNMCLNEIGAEFGPVAYDNDLNFIMGYVNEFESYNMHSLDKFLNADTNIRATNVLYPLASVTQQIKYDVIKILKNDNVTKFEKVIVRKNTKNDWLNIYDDRGIFIERISQNDFEKILANNDLEYIEQQTSAYTIDNKINPDEGFGFAEEYLFDMSVPLLNLKEVFLANTNVMNRINIISLNKNGELFNGYLGTDFESPFKNQLLLTTSSTNINIGNDTLMDMDSSVNLEKYDSFKIKFDEVTIDAKNISVTGPNVSSTDINGLNICSTDLKLVKEPVKTPFKMLSDGTFVNLEFSVNEDSVCGKLTNDTFDNIDPYIGRYVDVLREVDKDKENINEYIGINWINVLRNMNVKAKEYKITFNNKPVSKIATNTQTSDVISYTASNGTTVENKDKIDFSPKFRNNFANVPCVHVSAKTGEYSVDYALTILKESSGNDLNYKILKVNDRDVVCMFNSVHMIYWIYDGICNIDITVPESMTLPIKATY